ncbi:MAG TPA: RHS repeat-associated core domain-containing protein [Blastocatellia bacterium]|nr:RHS repeat-associated core domain-containing protein [Blastocatellia bacterium]
MIPDAGYAVRAATDVAVKVAKDTFEPLPLAARWVKRLFSRTATPPRQDTLADRLAYVARLQITPLKLVGYQGQPVSFTALAFNASGEIIQGVRYDWESSNTDKVQIDDSGRATFLQPGLARITCRAGAISASAPVLVRLGHRPPQSDAEWRADQNALRPDGTTGQNGPGGTGGVAALLDRLAPTAYAQGGSSYSNADFAYDELWSEPRNLVGSPRNRAIEATRIGAVMPESNNFKMAIPLIDLSGRGFIAGLTLYYNSRVWSRHGSAIIFDAVESRPSPGFSLGFGRLVTYRTSTALKYLWISADGTRHYLGQPTLASCPLPWIDCNAETTVTLQTTDGSHLTYVGNASTGGTLYSDDGTKISISVVNNRLLPGLITDRNGNYVTITYKNTSCDPNCQEYCTCPIYPPPLTLDYITDTMGRVIQCNYDASYNLVSITAPGYGGTAQQPVTRTVAQFDYESRTVSNNFSGLTVENRPSQAMNFLKHVYLPATQSGYTFSYSAFGMIYNVSKRRQMSISQGGVISDGSESNSVLFNYQTASTPALTDAPAFTQRTENALNAPQSIYSYSRWDGSGFSVFIITQPDYTRQTIARYDPATAGYGGLLYYVQPQKADGTVMHTTTFSYTTDGGGSPQVLYTFDYDEASTPTLVAFDYDSYGNVTNRREYGYQVSGQWLVRRRTRNLYKTDASYVNAYLRSLVIESDMYDAQLDTNDTNDVLMAKTTYTYDNYQAMSGMEEYRDAQGNLPATPGHYGTYDASVTVRGNVTGTTRWYDISGNLSYTWLRKIDLFGNTVKEQLSCCNEQTETATQNTFWSKPEQVTKGAAGGPQLTVSAQYDFNTGVTKYTTDPNSLQTTVTTRDAALRPILVTTPTTAVSNVSYNDGTLSVTGSKVYDDNGTQKTVTTTTDYDGWGRVIHQRNIHGGQVNTTYDNMGRVASVSNPFPIDGSPSFWTNYSYDTIGRVTVVTLPDNQTVQTTYSGNSVIVTDQVSRKMERLSDGLGRLVTVNEQDSSGNLTQATNYSYDILDNLTQVNQANQLRSYRYDALSRLTGEKLPEQGDPTQSTQWTTTYTYTDFSQVATRTDARGVVTTYAYDSLHRLSQVSYNTVSGVTTAPTVTYTYDSDATYGTNKQGALVRVNVGTDYQERYTFDQYKRLSSTVFNIGTRSYTTGYQFNAAGQPLRVGHIGIQYDTSGRPSAIGGLSQISYSVAGQMTGDRISSSGLYNGNSINSVTDETFTYNQARLQMSGQTAVTTNSNAGSCVPGPCPPPPAGGTNLSLTYTYNATSSGQFGVGTTAGNAGQLLSVSGTVGGVSESATYTYDNYSRLVTANQTSNGSSAQRRFAYDRWGNRTGVWDAASGGNQIQSVSLQTVSFPGTGTAPTNRLSAVSGTSYTYDTNGNVTNDGSHSYTYDSENRLVNVDNGAAATYAYDQQNRRYKKTVGSSVTHYVWDGEQVLAEYNGSTGALQVNYWYAGSRLFEKTGGSTQVLLSDRLSVRLALSDVGVVAGRQSHLPFGEDFAESGTQQKQHFTSYERDSEAGTDYAVNRGYNQSVGRFLSADPYQASGGPGMPQSWNRYLYALADPVNQVDRNGLFSLTWGPEYCSGSVLGQLFCDFNPFPGVGTPPQIKLPERCSLNVATSGDQLSQIDIKHFAHHDESPNVTVLGAGVSTGHDLNGHSGTYWFFFYEVQVTLPSDDPDPDDWKPLVQLAGGDIGGWEIIGGRRYYLNRNAFVDILLPQAQDKGFPGFYFWIDAPDVPEERIIGVLGEIGDGRALPLLEELKVSTEGAKNLVFKEVFTGILEDAIKKIANKVQVKQN